MTPLYYFSSGHLPPFIRFTVPLRTIFGIGQAGRAALLDEYTLFLEIHASDERDRVLGVGVWYTVEPRHRIYCTYMASSTRYLRHRWTRPMYNFEYTRSFILSEPFPLLSFSQLLNPSFSCILSSS